MPPKVRQVAADILQHHGQLADWLNDHAAAWPQQPEPDQAPAYIADIMRILRLAESRAEREECDLFPMLVQAYSPR